MYCVVDIESSGGPFGKESMIEIAAFRYDGEEVVDQLISLVHPHRKVQPFVSKMTGITDKMLIRAPRFHEIAKRLIEITEDAVIVGHNVEFDYRMIRQEFDRLGYQFERSTLDTINLAESLIPGLKSYGLDSLCQELGLTRPAKHRAEHDARATLELFEILRDKDQSKGINSFEQSVLEGDYHKDKIRDLLRSVKHNKGIYYLHDRHGKLLYLGASDNVKAAINRLFMGDGERITNLKDLTYTLKVEPTGNWLVARIKKQEELNLTHPSFNRIQKQSFQVGIYVDQRENPPKIYSKDLEQAGKKKNLFKVSNNTAAQRALRMYNRMKKGQRAQDILKLLLDFPERALFQAKGRQNGEKAVFVIEDGQLKGYLFYKLNDKLKSWDRVHNLMTPVQPEPEYLDLLKLGILAGEFSALSDSHFSSAES
ncbi:MAG: exonuclease domain-containing protein [Croceimicrobium sp.]